MNKPFFSVIIPSYNSENTLRETVLSVTSQDYKDIEVLIIDDASKDWSFVLAHELADADERIRVIALADNNGAAEARNKGISEAEGRYILFLDSDDIYSQGLFSKVYEAAKDEPDVIIWGAREEYADSLGNIKDTKDIVYDDKKLDDQLELRKVVMDLEELSLYGYLWNKAYKADIIKGITIPNQSFNEDEMFNILFFYDISSARILSFVGTHYRKSTLGSLTHRELFDYYPIAMNRVAGLMQQHKMWLMYTDDVRARLANIYLRYILSTLERLHRPAMGRNEKARMLFMQRVFSSKLYREMVPYMNPTNPILKNLAKKLKNKNAKGALRLGKLLHDVRRFAPGLFLSGTRR